MAITCCSSGIDVCGVNAAVCWFILVTLMRDGIMIFVDICGLNSFCDEVHAKTIK